MRGYLPKNLSFESSVKTCEGAGGPNMAAADRLEASTAFVEEVRFWKVLQIREALANGTYHVPLDRLAESMLTHKQARRRATKTMYPV